MRTPLDIWGPLTVAWYDWTPPYLATTGALVDVATNRANPGTYDLGAVGAARPTYTPSALDGYGCADFDGVANVMVANGLPGAVNDVWDVYVVLEYLGVPPAAAVGYVVYADNGGGLSQVGLNLLGDYGMEYRAAPGGYAANRGGVLDTSPHLMAGNTYDAGIGNSNGDLRLDGAVIAAVSAAQFGTLNALTRVGVGGVPGGASPANVRLREMVMVLNDTQGAAHAAQYEARIRRLYPSVPV